MTTIRSICVYCGSSPGNNPVYVEAGRQLGREIAKAGMRLVYGGGTKGIMGAVAEGAMSEGGRVTGIIPRFLITKERTASELDLLDELVTTADMHERKHIMFEKSDAFVALPGGIGTLEEIVEIMTWAQLGRHRKPIVFANVEGFWQPMLTLLDHMRAEGFVHTGHLLQPLLVDRPEDLVGAIREAAAAISDADGDERVIEKL